MILAALLLAAFLVNLDTTLVNVALPAMVRELHATTTQLQWAVDSFNLVFAALLLTFGSLSGRFGRKGMLLAGLAVFGTASLAGGFTTDPAQLIAAPTESPPPPGSSPGPPSSSSPYSAASPADNSSCSSRWASVSPPPCSWKPRSSAWSSCPAP